MGSTNELVQLVSGWLEILVFGCGVFGVVALGLILLVDPRALNGDPGKMTEREYEALNTKGEARWQRLN